MNPIMMPVAHSERSFLYNTRFKGLMHGLPEEKESTGVSVLLYRYWKEQRDV